MLWFVLSSIHIQYNTVYILDSVSYRSGANNTRNVNNGTPTITGTLATPGKQGTVQHLEQKERQKQKGHHNSRDATNNTN